MNRAFLAARNPLILPATSLPGPLLLMARLVVLVLVLQGYATRSMPARRVPFLAGLEAFGTDEAWKLALAGLFFAGAGLLLFNLRPRFGCLLAGGALMLGTLIDSANYANSRLFPGCLLVLTAFQDGTPPARLALRAQIFLLYFGATLSKVFEPDWWSGQYFEFWLREKLAIGWYARAADALPPKVLSAGMGVATMVIEIAICVALLRRAWWGLAFAIAVVFHVGAFLVSGQDFGVFLYVSILSFMVFAPDDLFPRLAALPVHPAVRGAATRPWVWLAVFVTLPHAGAVSPAGQKLAVLAVALVALRLACACVRESRAGASPPAPGR
jgi:hypothetical protein